jgi:uncharacterized protein YndB with AHSA1/START domain
MRITEHVLVERPPPDVWAVLVDLESHPRWRPALREFRQGSDGPLAVGLRVREVLVWRGREIVLDDEITVLEPGRRLGIRGLARPVDSRAVPTRGERGVRVMELTFVVRLERPGGSDLIRSGHGCE